MGSFLQNIFIILRQRKTRCKVVAQSNKGSFSQKRSLLFVRQLTIMEPFSCKNMLPVYSRVCNPIIFGKFSFYTAQKYNNIAQR